VSEKNTAPTPVSIDPLRIVEGVEPLLTVKEAAALLRWSPDSARRYFKDLPGVLVKYQPKRHKRAYRHYMIPKSSCNGNGKRWRAPTRCTGVPHEGARCEHLRPRGFGVAAID
jgi:hypothetical protein